MAPDFSFPFSVSLGSLMAHYLLSRTEARISTGLIDEQDTT